MHAACCLCVALAEREGMRKSECSLSVTSVACLALRVNIFAVNKIILSYFLCAAPAVIVCVNIETAL